MIETVRTFLAEWIVVSRREPDWEPMVPEDFFEFGLAETRIHFDTRYKTFITFLRRRLIWMCLRELQRKVVTTWGEDENLSGNASLIMLFLLGFPLLDMYKVEDTEGSVQEIQEVKDVNTTSFSSRQDLSVHSWRVWCVLAPQDISLVLQVDLTKRTVSLRLLNSSGDTRFMWED